MSKTLALVIAVCATIFEAPASQAQQLLDSYQAFLSERDHFNSSGLRLTTAAAIIRQDRANYHRFGLRDQSDEGDNFFANADNRAALERLLERGRAEPGVIASIVNGTPLVRVEVWQGSVGPFVVVTLIEPPNKSGDGTQTKENSKAVSASGVYTPAVGSPEHNAIMDAARLAQRASVRFQVGYLAVFRNGNASIAIADLNDADKQMPYGGLMFFEATNGNWRALYSMYMDGSESCEHTIKISEEMMSKANAVNAPKSLFPEKFSSGYDQALTNFDKEGNRSDCATTARY
jgi:hypothetical protein